jgi:hypothetical protein
VAVAEPVVGTVAPIPRGARVVNCELKRDEAGESLQLDGGSGAR